MEFSPNIKPKKCRHSKESHQPFPILSKGIKIKGVFTGLSVEIYDRSDIFEIFENGNFGKGSKSRSFPQIAKTCSNSEDADENNAETLVLDLEESFFLSHIHNILEIQDINAVVLDIKDVFLKFCKIKNNFLESMVGYLYLKSKNWVVKSGMKFGGNFLIYKKGMRYYHASFIVIVNNKSMKPKDIQGLQRIAETSDKDVLFLNIQSPSVGEIIHEDQFNLFQNLKNFSISEMIIKRFNFNQFVQS